MDWTMDIMNTTSIIKEIEGQDPLFAGGEKEPREYKMFLVRMENGLEIYMDPDSAKNRYVGEKVNIRVTKEV